MEAFARGIARAIDFCTYLAGFGFLIMMLDFNMGSKK